MSELDHNPAPRPERAPARIGVRALLSAGQQRPQVALVIPRPGDAPPRQVHLSLEDAAELAGRLLALASMARYDAAVHAALARSGVSDEANEALQGVLIGARAQMQEPS